MKELSCFSVKYCPLRVSVSWGAAVMFFLKCGGAFEACLMCFKPRKSPRKSVDKGTCSVDLKWLSSERRLYKQDVGF